MASVHSAKLGFNMMRLNRFQADGKNVRLSIPNEDPSYINKGEAWILGEHEVI